MVRANNLFLTCFKDIHATYLPFTYRSNNSNSLRDIYLKLVEWNYMRKTKK